MIARTLSVLFIVLSGASTCLGQGQAKAQQGKVTFITSNNVYVRFDDTKSISVGDTLKLSRSNTLTPCLIVKNKSSTSCVAVLVNGCDVKVGEQMVYVPLPSVAAPIIEEGSATKSEDKPIGKPVGGRKIRGSISAASYSTLSADNGNTTKAMYRFSLSAPHINKSKFSFETYMTYRQTFQSADNTSSQPADIFNVYGLAIQFDASPSLSFVLGRRINPKISSIGAIDGLQVEKSVGNFFAGIVGGFRPDVIDYSFNPHLLQYGGYIGVKSEANNFYSATTLGLMEQNNQGNTDRRYGYFQHSSTISQNVNVFAAFELDLYNQVNADSIGDPRLTNLYVSAAYRVGRKLDFSLSYSSRRQILYYETLKTEIERLLDDDIARQGLRLSVNARPVNHVGLGVSYSKRFQQNDLNNADNINGYASWSKIPWIGGRLYVNYNRNTSNYMQNNIVSFRHSRTLVKTKLEGEVYFRMVDYDYFDSETIVKQQYYGASLSYRIAQKLTIHALGELAATEEYNNYRVNARLTKNF